MANRAFTELIASYQAGDPVAQQELLRKIEQFLLFNVRRSMGRQLRNLEESIDISQQLMLKFHQGLMSGKLVFDNEAAMKGYLRSVVRNKLANVSDFRMAAKRGGGAVPASLDRESTEGVPITLPVDDLTASMFVRAEETQTRIRTELTDEEQLIFEGHLLGRTNAEMAKELGRTPDAVRMIWFRARERLARRGIIEKQKDA